RQTAKALQEALADVHTGADLSPVRAQSSLLLRLAQARDGVFEVRGRELALFVTLQTLVDGNRAVTDRMVVLAQNITNTVGHDLDAEIASLERRLQGSSWLLQALALVSVLLSLVLGSFYVGRRIAQ